MYDQIWLTGFMGTGKSRVVRPLAAGAVVLLAVVWSVPSYPVPMPSWFNLFCATFGVAALLRYLETEHRAWLFAAGVAGGLSLLVKITGLYYVAGALLFLAYHEQNRAPRGQRLAGRIGPYQVLLGAGLALFLALLVRMVASVPGVANVVYFAVPPALVALLVLWHERDLGAAPGGRRISRSSRRSRSSRVGSPASSCGSACGRCAGRMASRTRGASSSAAGSSGSSWRRRHRRSCSRRSGR